jgi:SAM-dependent methyltransferase
MGFDFEVVDAVDYDELRPSYSPAAIRWVAERARLQRGSTVVDLAAGTGQLARAFASLGCEVLAVEPARNMRAVLRSNAPEVTALAGTAEAIPVGDGATDAVVVGNAFHHFDADVAFDEIRRVLRPGSALALFWARSGDEEPAIVSITREIDRLVERVRGSSELVDAYRAWFDPPEAIDGFTAFERGSFPISHVMPSSRVADLYATSSDIASLPSSVRDDLLARIAELTARLPETIEIAERSDVQLCVRIERA